MLIWREVQVALHRNDAKNVLYRETFYFYTLSTFQYLYFITFTWVKKLSQYFYFSQSLFLKTITCTSTKVKNVCSV